MFLSVLCVPMAFFLCKQNFFADPMTKAEEFAFAKRDKNENEQSGDATRV